MTDTVPGHRAPVLTLWAAAVAERLGFERDEALALGRALAGLTAHAKGVRLGILEPPAPERLPSSDPLPRQRGLIPGLESSDLWLTARSRPRRPRRRRSTGQDF